MPTYQYACTECGEPLEVVQSFTDDALTECPSCGGRLRKRFNAVGIVFKGSGFYRTDSRSSSSGSAGGSNSESAVPTGTAAAKSSDNGAKSEGAAASGSTNGSTKSGANGSGESKKAAPAASSSGGSSDTSAA